MNFTELKTKVADYAVRPDLVSTIVPDMINMALHDLEQDPEINWKHMEAKATGNVTSSTDTIAIPTRYKEVKCLSITIDTKREFLTKTSYSDLMITYPYDANVKTIPEKFALYTADSVFYLRPYPDTTYAYELTTYNYSADLSASNLTNWFTNNAWELLVYGALIEMQPYLKAPQAIAQIPVWQGLYERRLNKLKRISASEDWAGSHQRIRYEGIPA